MTTPPRHLPIGASVAAPTQRHVLINQRNLRKPTELRGGEADGRSANGGPSVDRNVADPLRAILVAILQPPSADLTRSDGVFDWPFPLRAYQQEGIQTLISRPQLLLADEMGLGKTIQVLAALRILYHRGEIGRALIVAPASLLRQWQREAAKWVPELRVVLVAAPATERAALWRTPSHVYIASYETVREDVSPNFLGPSGAEPWDVVVLDEASKIKNRDSQVARAVKRLPRLRRWALTGTPIENHIDDVCSILEFILNESAPTRSLFLTPSQLRPLLAEHQLRRRKADVLQDLPPKTVENLLVELPAAQRAAYDKAETEGVVQLKAYGAKITVTHILELVTRLKQICNVDPVSGESAKLRDIQERMKEVSESGHRALLFSQFTDENFGVQWAAARLKQFHPLSYTGAMSASQRAETTDRFIQDDRHKLLILSLKAGGMGLNLQAASYVFHLDRWWNPAIEEQSEARAHRMGQLLPVMVYRYTCINTIEERIETILESKRDLFRDLIDDVTLDLSRVMSRSEIFGLFDLGGSNDGTCQDT